MNQLYQNIRKVYLAENYLHPKPNKETILVSDTSSEEEEEVWEISSFEAKHKAIRSFDELKKDLENKSNQQLIVLDKETFDNLELVPINKHFKAWIFE